jgi:putative transposase
MGVRGRRLERPIVLSEDDRLELERLMRSLSTAHGVVRRAQAILASADGETTSHIAGRLGVSQTAVHKWRNRYLDLGLAGLYDGERPGRPRTHGQEAVTRLLTTVLDTQPEGATHWTMRAAAAATGLSKSTVARTLALFNVKAHRRRTFKLSSDPEFVDKVTDIVGLYLNPPDKALVLCVDEKSSIQALERTQPILPLGLGYVEGVTHDYIRHGTTTLFAALDVASGQVIAQCRPRHRHQEFLGFLNHIDENVPPDLDIHLVIDNYATHKHAKVRTWLAERPRYHVHYTPTSASWLNQVERWFALITQRQIKRGADRSAKDLIRRIQAFVAAYNAKATPFQWTATAQSILDKVARICKAISGTGH